jgi:hypothetical protein
LSQRHKFLRVVTGNRTRRMGLRWTCSGTRLERVPLWGVIAGGEVAGHVEDGGSGGKGNEFCVVPARSLADIIVPQSSLRLQEPPTPADPHTKWTTASFTYSSSFSPSSHSFLMRLHSRYRPRSMACLVEVMLKCCVRWPWGVKFKS